MIISIDIVHSFATDLPTKVLTTSGCGCCSKRLSLTLQNITSAIEEHEMFLTELRKLQNEITLCQPK